MSLGWHSGFAVDDSIEIKRQSRTDAASKAPLPLPLPLLLLPMLLLLPGTDISDGEDGEPSCVRSFSPACVGEDDAATPAQIFLASSSRRASRWSLQKPR